MKKTTRSQYLMRANLNVRPLVDIAQFAVAVSHMWGGNARRFPEKKKNEEK